MFTVNSDACREDILTARTWVKETPNGARVYVGPYLPKAPILCPVTVDCAECKNYRAKEEQEEADSEKIRNIEKYGFDKHYAKNKGKCPPPLILESKISEAVAKRLILRYAEWFLTIEVDLCTKVTFEPVKF